MFSHVCWRGGEWGVGGLYVGVEGVVVIFYGSVSGRYSTLSLDEERALITWSCRQTCVFHKTPQRAKLIL